MEEKKMSIFKRLENNIFAQVIFFAVSMVVIVGIYVGVSGKIQWKNLQDNIKELTVVEDYDVLINVEKVSKEDDTLNLSGWGLRTESVVKEMHVVLKEVESGKEMLLVTKLSEREEVENYFNPKWEFGTVGFVSEVAADGVSEDVSYEILINIKYESNGGMVSKKITTSKYLYNGELYEYNPKMFKVPQVKDEQLLTVIEDGNLKAYVPEENLWIYQYQDSLYFIVDSRFGSLKESGIVIPVMVHTTNDELLPEKHKEIGFEQLGSYCESESFQKEGVLPYQIVVVGLPTEYPIKYIVTGLYESLAGVWITEIVFTSVD